MTTGRINQVTILNWIPQPFQVRSPENPPQGKVRVVMWKEAWPYPSQLPRPPRDTWVYISAGTPEDHPVAPTEFPK